MSRCEYCGEQLLDKRADARHCGGPCRAAASRARAAERAGHNEARASDRSDEESAQRRTDEASRRPQHTARPTPPLTCPYNGHRAYDWLSIHGVVVCGICHPPASRDLVASELRQDDTARAHSERGPSAA